MSTPSGDPTFKVERHGQDVTVPLGEHRLLDESAVRGIRESLMSLAANQVGGVLTLNLKRVEYLGSAMLETLIKVNGTVVNTPGRQGTTPFTVLFQPSGSIQFTSHVRQPV